MTYRMVLPLFNVKVKQQFVYSFKLKPDDEFIWNLSLMPWDRNNNSLREEVFKYAETKSLSRYKDFDIFDYCIAQSILILDTFETYPNGFWYEKMTKTPQHHSQSLFIPKFLESLKLIDDSEPHYFKTLHFKSDKKYNGFVEARWPIKEMQGSPLVITEKVFNKLISMTIKRFIRKDYNGKGDKVLKLATEYYILTSTQTEYHIIFLFLMIAFEALFKDIKEKDVNKAVRRFSILFSDTKKTYSEISKFMSPDKKCKGCCYIRNAIVHGDVEKLSPLISLD